MVSVLAPAASLVAPGKGCRSTPPRCIRVLGAAGDEVATSGVVGMLDLANGSFDLGGLRVDHRQASVRRKPVRWRRSLRAGARHAGAGRHAEGRDVRIRDGNSDAEAELKGNVGPGRGRRAFRCAASAGREQCRSKTAPPADSPKACSWRSRPARCHRRDREVGALRGRTQRRHRRAQGHGRQRRSAAQRFVLTLRRRHAQRELERRHLLRRRDAATPRRPAARGGRQARRRRAVAKKIQAESEDD